MIPLFGIHVWWFFHHETWGKIIIHNGDRSINSWGCFSIFIVGTVTHQTLDMNQQLWEIPEYWPSNKGYQLRYPWTVCSQRRLIDLHDSISWSWCFSLGVLPRCQRKWNSMGCFRQEGIWSRIVHPKPGNPECLLLSQAQNCWLLGARRIPRTRDIIGSYRPCCWYLLVMFYSGTKVFFKMILCSAIHNICAYVCIYAYYMIRLTFFSPLLDGSVWFPARKRGSPKFRCERGDEFHLPDDGVVNQWENHPKWGFNMINDGVTSMKWGPM